MNEISYFLNHELNEYLSISDGDPETTGSVLKSKEEYYDTLKTAQDLNASNFLYTQTIFPRAFNTFRDFSVQKLAYPEASNTNTLLSYNRQMPRTFWKDSQPAGAVRNFAQSTTHVNADAGYVLESRMRDPELAVNSQNINQGMHYIYRYFETLPEDAEDIISGAGDVEDSVTGSINIIIQPGLFATTTFREAFGPEVNDAYGTNVTINYTVNGVVTNQTNSLNLPEGKFDSYRNISSGSNLVQLDAYQPYPLALLSIWPLDVRDDVYDKPNYLTSSRGGNGLMIGMSPHSATSSVSAQKFEGSEHLYTLNRPYADMIEGLENMITRSSGELVYNTKPTIFFRRYDQHYSGTLAIDGGFSKERIAGTNIGLGVGPRTLMGEPVSSIDYTYLRPRYSSRYDKADDGEYTLGEVHEESYGGKLSTSSSFTIHGYEHATASLQYLRHVYPYNTPFWVTNKIIGRNPMYNSYEQFIGSELKAIAKDYSIVPEFTISDNYEYYSSFFENYENSQELVFYRKQDPVNSKYKILRAINADVSDYFNNKEAYRFHKLNFLKLHGATGVTSSAATLSKSDILPDSTYYKYSEVEPGNPSEERFSSTEKKHTYTSDAKSVEFYERYCHTDSMLNFSHIVRSQFIGPNLIPSRIKFKCRGIKKLLPYNGLYPVTRTVQLGGYLKNAFGSDRILKSLRSNHELPMKLQALIEPIMAPGVLYNSIKSGVAVSHPYHQVSSQQHTNYGYTGMIYHVPVGEGNADLRDFSAHGGSGYWAGPNVTASIPYGGLQAQGARLCLPGILKSRAEDIFLGPRGVGGSSGVRSASVAYSNLDFDSIRNVRSLKDIFWKTRSRYPRCTVLLPDYIDLNRNPHASGSYFDTDGLNDYPGPEPAVLGGYQVPDAHFFFETNETTPSSDQLMYQDGIHNFLAETMEFFLADQTPGVKFPIAFSNPIDTDIMVDLNKIYYGAVTLEMGKDQVMCEGPRASGLHISSSANDTWNNTGSMRGYLYGPPIEIVKYGDTTVQSLNRWGRTEEYTHHELDHEGYYRFNLQDPAYQCYTPPYFYGKSSMVFSFAPETQTNDLLSVYSVCNSTSGSYYRDLYDLDNKLAVTVPTTSSYSRSTATRMKIDASIDIFNPPVQIHSIGQERPDKNIWYINPKWVSPVLDFSSSFAVIEETSYDEQLGSPGITQTRALSSQGRAVQRQLKLIENGYHSASTGKSMWGGYGTDPYDAAAMQRIYDTEGLSATSMEKGIYLKIEDPFKGSHKKMFFAAGINRINPGLTQDLGDVFSEISQAQSISYPTGSLVTDLKIFDEQSLRIGQIAPKKLISEAVAVIPYFETPIQFHFAAQNQAYGGEFFETREIIPGKHFLPINKGVFENILSILLSREFYDSDEPEFNQSWGNSNTTYERAQRSDCGEMINSLLGLNRTEHNGYQLPPEFDFLHNAALDPFQMIILPFEHVLSKQDLINIYQGIMPEVSIRMEKQLSTAVINPNSELFNDSSIYPPEYFITTTGEKLKTDLSDYNFANFLSPLIFTNTGRTNKLSKSQTDGLVPNWSVRDFYRNMRFMVFKIKQRAEKNYDTYKKRQISRAIKTKFIDSDQNKASLEMPEEFERTIKNRLSSEIYGTNWPYDYFSLIEAIKLDIEVGYDS